MKVKGFRNVAQSIFSLILVILLLLSVATWRGQIFGSSLKHNAEEAHKFELTISNCKQVFATAYQLTQQNDEQFNIYDKSNNLLGYVLAQGAMGYGGKVPVYSYMDVNDIIVGVTVGKHFESDEYFAKVIKSGLLDRWVGIERSKINDVTVDVVSGATLTSDAIIIGVSNSASAQTVLRPFQLYSVDNIASFLLLLVLTFACFFPSKLMKYRTVLQLLSVVIFGFWLGRFLSFVQLINWLSAGINWRVQIFMILVLVLSVVIPLIFGKAFYCTWVCPFGAAQELCGKVCSKKIPISPKSAKLLKPLRERLFIVLLVLLWSGYAFDLTLIEPFSAFSVKIVSYWMLGFAGLFLVVSMFVPKAWCRFFCPTGFVLEWIRR